MEGLFALGGVALGWLLGVGTQIWRDRRQERIALSLLHNEVLGNIAQLDLARRMGVDASGTIQLSHWERRWRLSRQAWDRHGATAMGALDDDAIAAVQDSHHALDAAELLLEEGREAVIAVRELELTTGDNAAAVDRVETEDAGRRERLGVQLDALHKAHEAIDQKLGLSGH